MVGRSVSILKMTEGEKKKYARVVYKSVSLRRVLDRLRKHYRAEREPKSLVVPVSLRAPHILEMTLQLH